MEIHEIRQELNQLLENIVDHSGKYNAERPMPSLEVSFVLKKINKMQENLIIFKYLLQQQELLAKKVKKTSIEEIIEEPVFEEPEAIEEVVVEEQIKVEPEHEVIVEKEIPKVENIKETSIVKLSDNLTLNDRYLYANELCNKDMSAFSELVKSIDTCASFDEAVKIYSSMDWELDNEHVISFTNLIERRFS